MPRDACGATCALDESFRTSGDRSDLQGYRPAQYLDRMTEQSVGVIGVGRLGSDVAFALAERDLGDIVLYDQDVGRAEYLAQDLSDTSFGRIYNRRIRSVPEMRDLADCDVILVAAGARMSSGADPANVFAANKAIAEEIAVAFAGSSSVFIVASEPVDLMTAYLRKQLMIPQSRVLGIGGIVDAFVARNAIGDALDISPDYIRTHVVGPHGSGAQLVWHYTRINGVAIEQIADEDQIKQIELHAKRELEERDHRMDQSDARFAPATASVELIRSIVRNDRRIHSVTMEVSDVYGVSGTAMSVPCIVGRFGADRVFAPPLDKEAQKTIQDVAASAAKLIAGGAK